MNTKRFLVLSLLLTNLIACSNSNAQPKEVIQKELPDIITDEAVVPELKVETIVIDDKFYTISNRSYVELDLKLPVLSGDYKGIEEINSYYDEKHLMFYHSLNINMIEEIEAGILASLPISPETPEEEIEEDYIIKGRLDNYWQMGHYEMTSQFGKFISFKGDLNGGQGGVSWLAQEGDVFDLDTGKRLEISDIFKVSSNEYDERIYTCIKKIMINQIEKNTEDVNHYQYVLEVDDSVKRNLILKYDRNNFYFNKEGLVIPYQKYSLGDGASGIISFTIPFSEIEDILATHILDCIKE